MPAEPTLAPAGPSPADAPLQLFLARLANGISPASVLLAQADWLGHLAASPGKQAELAASAWHKLLQWTQYAGRSCYGECPGCIEPEPRDKRFSAPQWSRPPYKQLAQAFLLQEHWWAEAGAGVRGVSRHHQEVAAFAVRQWLDMFAPSNFVPTNPEVLEKTLRTGGANLAGGFSNGWRDAATLLANGSPRGVERFAVGRDVACTPGRVVMRNRLAELIEYAPSTARVDAEPVLIVPSWIMKYYILDLTPQDSLVQYLVGQGHRVFMVSWRNPDSGDRDLGMEDYLQLGVVAALQEVRRRAAGRKVHCAGYCLGGTLLSIAAAAPQTGVPDAMATLTLLAAQTDFAEPGELGLFIDESQIAFLENLMAGRGFLDGRQMAGAFALINSRDLVWSRLVHEYLMGAETPMTALRAWNADATRLPARMHSQYLRGLYLHNDLAEGRFRVAGRPVSLAGIRVPLFALSTEQDHVSPWASVYKIHHLAAAPVTFVLVSGGHNAGVVSPASGPGAKPQAHYRIATSPAMAAPAEPQQWRDGAPLVQGSWWPAWHAWLRAHSSARVPAVPVGRAAGGLGVIEAPGAYVHQR
ncbi:PHA/PHB synthase family protein [Polaromonas sp. YR568]|uniref:PHA/PHB synthase family protein n=1 Tax=Polaromonas sp. YR568 TaxID=1855301 RepID=UPI00398BD317